MVQSAAMNVTGDVKWQWTERGTRHIMYAFFAIVAYFVVGNIDYGLLARRAQSIWRRPIFWALVIATVACLPRAHPARRHREKRGPPLAAAGDHAGSTIRAGKWAVVLFLAGGLPSSRWTWTVSAAAFLVTLAPIGVITTLIVIQDFGTAALIAICTIAMLVAGRVKWWHLAAVIPPAIAAAAWFVMHKEYRWRRMTAFVDPWAAPRGEGYHMIQSLMSFSTGASPAAGWATAFKNSAICRKTRPISSSR
jgi:cell division protein FtsW